ncbi:hypothetical protein PSEMO_31380 [Pseudomonas putida]|uniref:PAAR domain-containing protein n=1 Tax=Pseudomonas putida TaxID=303 RepID=A0A1Q9R4A0_PSEPU|nr:hypothetical protein PSEMO_31380 [Pseudomonas putida]
MARPLACLGDKTTYGQVLSATATWYEGDKPIVQTGDLARCDKCDGSFPIVGTAIDWCEDQPYVATGDRVACRCPDHVVYGSTTQITAARHQPEPRRHRQRPWLKHRPPIRQPALRLARQRQCLLGYSPGPALAPPKTPALRSPSPTSAGSRSSGQPLAKQQREQRWQACRLAGSLAAVCWKVLEPGRSVDLALPPRHSPVPPIPYCWRYGHPTWPTGRSTPKNSSGK